MENFDWDKLTKTEKRLDILRRFKHIFKALNKLADTKPEYRRNRLIWNFSFMRLMLDCLWRAELPTVKN